MKEDFMTKAEKNYKRDYGHKSNEELDNVLETVNFNKLMADESSVRIMPSIPISTIQNEEVRLCPRVCESKPFSDDKSR